MFSYIKKNDVSYIILSLILSLFRVLSPFRSAFYPHSVPRFIPIPFRVLSPFRSAFYPHSVPLFRSAFYPHSVPLFRSAFPFRSAIPVPRYISTPQECHNVCIITSKSIKTYLLRTIVLNKWPDKGQFYCKNNNKVNKQRLMEASAVTNLLTFDM